MQQLIEKSATLTMAKKTWLPYIIFAVSAASTLVGIFVLSAWAETSGWHHAAQHVIIFGSGFTAGGSILSVFKTKKGE